MNVLRIAGIAKVLAVISALSLLGLFGAAADHLAANSGAKLTGKLLLTGSSTMAPLMADIAQRFRALHPGVAIEVRTGGSGVGIADARAGKAHIGMVSRALDDDETDLLGFSVARDGVAVVVHRNNPVETLSDQQLRDIFTGKIGNWKDVGGRDEPITVLAGEATRSSSELLADYLKIKYSDIKAATVLGDNPERIKAVEENPQAIVYLSVGEADRNAQAGEPVKLLAIGGVAATTRNIRTRDYPIARSLTLVTKDQPTGLVKEFIAFSMSPQATEAIEKFDFVPYLD